MVKHGGIFLRALIPSTLITPDALRGKGTVYDVSVTETMISLATEYAPVIIIIGVMEISLRICACNNNFTALLKTVPMT